MTTDVAVVIPLKLVYTPVDATVTSIRNYQVPSTKSQSRSIQEWWRICRRFTPSWTQAAGMPPPEYSVRSHELPVSMRMRMRVVMCGYACTCAREFNSASRP